VYLVTALPTVVLLSFLTPPFQVADEGNHFRRVVHILRGGIVGKRVSQDMSGGPIPAPAVDIDVPTVPLINHPERKVDPAMVAALRGQVERRKTVPGFPEHRSVPSNVLSAEPRGGGGRQGNRARSRR
jgi:hypothetical protein